MSDELNTTPKTPPREPITTPDEFYRPNRLPEKNMTPWLDPTPTMLATPEFEAVWQCIKTWDINVPEAYGGYCGATGNHVRAILDALAKVQK